MYYTIFNYELQKTSIGLNEAILTAYGMFDLPSIFFIRPLFVSGHLNVTSLAVSSKCYP